MSLEIKSVAEFREKLKTVVSTTDIGFWDFAVKIKKLTGISFVGNLHPLSDDVLFRAILEENFRQSGLPNDQHDAYIARAIIENDRE